MLRRGGTPSIASPLRLLPQPALRPAHLRQASLVPTILQWRAFSAAPSADGAEPPSPLIAFASANASTRPLRASDQQRPRYTYRETARPASRWHIALRQRQFGTAIEHLRKENPDHAPAWTEIVTAAGRAGQGAHIATVYNTTSVFVKQDPIFWMSIFAACRQPNVHMSQLAVQVAEDLMREYRHAWYDSMPQMLVNVFLAISASESNPQLAMLARVRDWARSKSLLYQSEPYSALVYCYQRRKKLTEMVSVMEEATSEGIIIHKRNFSEAVNALIIGNRPHEALTWTKHAAAHAIPIEPQVLNALHRQLCAAGQFDQSTELEAVFDIFNHKPDVVACTKLMLAMSSSHAHTALPRLVDLFESKVKPIADEEAYRVLLRTLGRAGRGDLVLKYWQEVLAKPFGQTLSKKFFEQLVQSVLACGDLTTVSTVLQKVPVLELSADVVGEVAVFLAHSRASNDKFVQKLVEVAQSGKATKPLLNSLIDCYSIAGRRADVLSCYQYFSKNTPMDETSFCFFFDSCTTPAQLSEQVGRLLKEVQQQSARLLLTDRTRGAVLKALLRTGVKVNEAKDRAQQLAEQIGHRVYVDYLDYENYYDLPPPGAYANEGLLLHKLEAVSSAAELRALEVEVAQHESLYRGQASTKAVDTALLTIATRLGDQQLMEKFSRERRERRGGLGAKKLVQKR